MVTWKLNICKLESHYFLNKAPIFYIYIIAYLSIIVLIHI